MHVLGQVVFWLVFAIGAAALLLMALSLLLDGVIRNRYRGASSYRRDERMT